MRIDPDPLTQFAPWLTGPASPTADLYFARPCRDLLDSGKVRQLAPTVFQCGRTVVVVRHALGLKDTIECDRLVYVIDDDWRAGLRDVRLPPAYRAKLAVVEARAARRLERRADFIVIGSEALADFYRARSVEPQIVPFLPTWPVPDPAIEDPDAPLRIAYLGAWTHVRDADIIAEALQTVLYRYEYLEVCLTTAFRHASSLRADGRVHILPAMSWLEYQNWLAGQRFDIGLYPLHDTAFNRARSINKVFEYAQTGAVTLLSESWRPTELRGFESAVVHVTNDTQSWIDAIDGLVSDATRRHRLRENAREAMKRLKISKSSRAQWAEILGLELDATQECGPAP